MKTKIKLAIKRRLPKLLNYSEVKMTAQHDPKKPKHQLDENITSDAASKVVSVELNKQLPAKEIEQDPIPSDDEEDGYPQLKLDPLKVAERKRALQKSESERKESA